MPSEPRPYILAKLGLGSAYAAEADVSCCMNQYPNVSNSSATGVGREK